MGTFAARLQKENAGLFFERLSRKTCASTCAVFWVLAFSNWVFAVSNWVFGFSDGIFACTNWDFAFLNCLSWHSCMKNVFLKGFSADCTKIDWGNWIYFGNLHKIAEVLQFPNWVLGFSNWVLAFSNWVLAFLGNWVLGKTLKNKPWDGIRYIYWINLRPNN